MIISMINHHLMWKMQKPLSTVASRWKSRARERNSSTIAQLREAGETTNATWFLVLKYMTVHDCTIIPSSVPIVVANQQISVSFPGETCFAMLRQAAERERLSSPPMSWSWKTRAVSHNFQFRWLLNYSTIPTSTITQDNLGSGHSFHFWLNEDLQQEYSQVVLRHMVMHIMRKNNGCDVCPNRTRPVLLYRWLEGISWLKTVSHKAAAQARKQTKETSINAHLRDDKSTSQWNWMNGISLAFDSCPVLVISSSCHTVINPSEKDMGVTVYS